MVVYHGDLPSKQCHEENETKQSGPKGIPAGDGRHQHGDTDTEENKYNDLHDALPFFPLVVARLLN
jgi:hypothetical protein